MYKVYVLSFVALAWVLLGIQAQYTAYSALGPSASNFVTDTRYVSSSLPLSETTSGFTSMNQVGHALGYVTNTGFQFADSLAGYAYGTNVNNFLCAALNPIQCVSNSEWCTLARDSTDNTLSCITKPKAITPSIPNVPQFFAKLHFHAKGTVRSVFVDIDTRTRHNEMEEFEQRAINYFWYRFGLDFSYFNTFEGAQMIPFKWTDEMYLQVQDATLPANANTIPERNRVLVDGFLVKPLYGETVVLRGTYASNTNKGSVFLDPDEILIYMEYRIVDEFNRLYHKFRFDLCEPLKTNRVGIAGWTASVIRIDHEAEANCECTDYYRDPPCKCPKRCLVKPKQCALPSFANPLTDKRVKDCIDPPPSCYDREWGVGVDQGILEIVEYDGLMDFAFSNVITFPGKIDPDNGVIKTLGMPDPDLPNPDPLIQCHEALFYRHCSDCSV